MKNERVAILTNSLIGGGTEKNILKLCDYFIEKKGMGVDLYLLSKESDFDLNCLKGIEIIYLSEKGNSGALKKILLIPFLSFRFFKKIKKQNYIASLSFLPRPNYINVIANVFLKTNVRAIINERSYPSNEYASKSLRSLINRVLIKALYNYSDKIIANAKGNAKDLKDNFNVKKNVEVIYNPIENVKLEKKLNSEKEINFVTVGRLDDNKNHISLINIIEKLNNNRVKLQIIGKGKLEKELDDVIKQKRLEKQVFLLGFKRNPYEYMVKSDAFLFTSKSEGFPNVILEALAHRTPVITYNCKSGPDEILLGELKEITSNIITDTGILVPANDEDNFVEAINYFLENKHNFKNIESFDNLVSRYSYSNTFEKIYQIIKK